ncbi:MAG: hypothetical protein ACI9EW_001879, partial [Cellvibrionaceae bacterium]
MVIRLQNKEGPTSEPQSLICSNMLAPYSQPFEP